MNKREIIAIYDWFLVHRMRLKRDEERGLLLHTGTWYNDGVYHCFGGWKDLIKLLDKYYMVDNA